MHAIAGFVLAMAAAAVLVCGPRAGAAAAERTFSITGLAVSYLRPDGAARPPLAVMISGSGATDRNGNSPPGLHTDAYKLLAQALAELGVASVRYDKRGVGGSADLARGEAHPPTMDVLAKDATAIAAWGRQQPEVGPVVLVGHAEGGVLALLAAKPSSAKAVVLLATPGRPLGVILREQVSRPVLPDELRLEALNIIAALERGEDVRSVRPELELLFGPGAQPFLKSWIRTDPAGLLRGLDVPVLVIGGGKDVQVVRADFDALTGARGGVKSHWYPAMNHALKLAGDDLQSQGRAYMDPKVALAEGLADWVAAFIHEAAGAMAKEKK